MLCALDHSDSHIIHRPFLTVESAGFVAEWLYKDCELLGLVIFDVFLVKTCIFLEQSLRSSSSPLKALEDRKFHLVYVHRRDGEKIWGATSVTKVRDSVFVEDTEDDDFLFFTFSEVLVDCIQRNCLPILEVM